ncbi:hypothetical protein FACS1894158_09200 [Betaproteobacteria bacterium]|nr:hypothetical protein FACS1894158_09200 [Betaproteobacteria bacterium]
MEHANTLHFALSDRIDDIEVGPAHVPLALLGQFQQDVTEFLRGSGRDINPDEVLVSIEDGSLKLVASGLLAASSLWADVAQLQNPSTLGLIDSKRAAVVERWQTATRKNPHRGYSLVDQSGKLKVRVDNNTDFRNQIEAVWVPVEKYLQGLVTDLGGTSRPNVHLKLDDGKMLIVTASQQQLADEEKNRLYKPALLRVSAKENLKTGELRDLNLLNFETLQPVWDEAEFKEMVRKGTQVWADVPDNWLEDLRSGRG